MKSWPGGQEARTSARWSGSGIAVACALRFMGATAVSPHKHLQDSSHPNSSQGKPRLRDRKCWLQVLSLGLVAGAGVEGFRWPLAGFRSFQGPLALPFSVGPRAELPHLIPDSLVCSLRLLPVP